MKPRLLDLFCGEGGAGYGYQQAGFDVIGVDLKASKRCPYPVIEADALRLDVRFLQTFDAIHASPPCQGFTDMRFSKNAKGDAGHPNLIPATRKLLIASGKPYIIENVRGAREHLIDPISIFGTDLDLHMVTSTGQRFDLSRERLFETNWDCVAPWHSPATNPIANVFGGHLRNRSAKHGGRKTRDFPGEDKPALARQLMEAPWMTMQGLSEAVPPPYTEWIGYRLKESDLFNGR